MEERNSQSNKTACCRFRVVHIQEIKGARSLTDLHMALSVTQFISICTHTHKHTYFATAKCFLMDAYHFGLMEVKISSLLLLSIWRFIFFRTFSPLPEMEK